jgi:hypothetical protein
MDSLEKCTNIPKLADDIGPVRLVTVVTAYVLADSFDCGSRYRAQNEYAGVVFDDKIRCGHYISLSGRIRLGGSTTALNSCEFRRLVATLERRALDTGAGYHGFVQTSKSGYATRLTWTY